jgi:polyisoprenoid-binding protein YceI
MKNKMLFIAAIAVLALGCTKDSSKDQPPAQVTSPDTVAKPAATGKTFTIAQGDSKVAFTGAKVTASHDGAFQKFSGTVIVPDGKVEQGSVTVDIDTDSLTIQPDKLQGHLKSKDLFDVATYPKATFASTAIVSKGDGKYDVTGNLNLHGVQKSITFPATIAVAGDVVTANAEFSINRKDFGIVYPGMPDDLIKDTVLIKLAIKATAKT